MSASISRGAPGRCTFTTTRAAVREHRAVHLADGGGCDRLGVELDEELLDRQAELLLDRRPSLVERERPDVVLEARSSAMMSGGSTSGRVESSWPNFTKVGPSSSSISRRWRPRSVGAPSSSGSFCFPGSRLLRRSRSKQ